MGVGVVTDDGHHCEGEHDQRDMPAPAMSESGLVVIEAKLALGRFEAVIDHPVRPFYRYQLCQGCALGTPGREEGKVSRIGDAAPDQQTARLWAGERIAVFAGIEIGQFEVGPIVQPRTFGLVSSRQRYQAFLGKPYAI